MSGRGNIDYGNCRSDLNQIWHGGYPHPQKGYRLCGYVVYVTGGRGMGVGGLGNFDPDNRWSDVDQN